MRLWICLLWTGCSIACPIDTSGRGRVVVAEDLRSGTVVTAEDAARWRSDQLQALGEKLANSPAEAALREEWQARRRWLQRWTPGQLPATPTAAVAKLRDAESLVEEPDLQKVLDAMPQPACLPPETRQALERAVQLQRRLGELDSDADRKQHLVATAKLALQLEQALTSLLETWRPTGVPIVEEPQTMRETLHETMRWALGHTRYRRARALAYRELPDVLTRLPINDAEAYEKELAEAHDRLRETFSEPQAEFVLLEIRMLRRAGKQGQALEKLERFGSTIELRWYLKKRRDLLGELDWGPPQEEAAKWYAEAGFGETSERSSDTATSPSR